MKEIKKLLVANRGEIALRIMRTARDRSIACVAVYSDADKNAPYVKFADEAIGIGGLSAAESYLNQDKIIAAAKRTGANAIHPGYGFLSENASFAQRCADEGLLFVGPRAQVITQLGSKAGAKEIMRKAGVPVVPGYEGADQTVGRFKYEAGEIGFPVLLKASAGGGGKGMRIVNSEAELEAAIEAASREAEKSFGDGNLLMEKYFPKAKHIEFQIFGDEHGNYLHLNERECSLQRRYQKVIEESPSPSLTPQLRAEMGEAALAAARAVNYTNAGTVEFLLDDKGHFFFLEVNTRLQVEHPVTEMTTGLDLVSLQLDVAQGVPLRIQQEEIESYGHAIECRICAEDPENNFLPATGDILYWQEPQGPMYVRFDGGVTTGGKVDIHYDSMLAKLICFGTDRQQAINNTLNALQQMVALGVTTNTHFLSTLLQHPAFVDGSFDTRLIEREFTGYQRPVSEQHLHETTIAALLWNWSNRAATQPFAESLNGWRNVFYAPLSFNAEIRGVELSAAYRRTGGATFSISIKGEPYTAEITAHNGAQLSVIINQHLLHFYVAAKGHQHYIHHPAAGNLSLKETPRFTEPGEALAKDGYYSPMPGEIIKVLVKPGDAVKSGQRLLVMSSMKMESSIEAHTDGEVEEVYVADKTFVEAGAVLLKMKEKG